MQTNKKLLFIPGGPWISGEYWDSFIENNFSSIPCERIVLMNHEHRYSSQRTPTFDEMLNDLKTQIVTQNSTVSLIGHSYGAFLILLLLDQLIIDKVDKIILTCMPFSTNRTKAVTDFVNSKEKINIQNNEDFTRYFNSILNLYFHFTSSAKKNKWITKGSYKEGNENLLINDDLVCKCIENLKIFEKDVSFIFADNDLIIGDSWKDCLRDQPKIIKGSGHFPMLEQPELFSNILNSVLK